MISRVFTSPVLNLRAAGWLGARQILLLLWCGMVSSYRHCNISHYKRTYILRQHSCNFYYSSYNFFVLLNLTVPNLHIQHYHRYACTGKNSIYMVQYYPVSGMHWGEVLEHISHGYVVCSWFPWHPVYYSPWKMKQKLHAKRFSFS